jgi:hypothetical protein
MALDLNNGKIVIFKNEDATEENRQPRYRGELKTPDGHQLEVSLWVRKSSKGMTYFDGQVRNPFSGSGSFEQTSVPKEETIPPPEEQKSHNPDDDIPF